MYRHLLFLVFSLLILHGSESYAQDLKTKVGQNKEMDSLRKEDEEGKDSTIFTSRFIRYTTLKLTKDSIQTMPLDTTLEGFHNFNLLVQPRRPTQGLGNLGLPALPLLFEPVKTIGFEAGFHTLDQYAMTHDDVKYYQARTPFTSLYYVSAGEAEQVLKIIHSQNIKPNLNIGANFNRIGANGYYARQRGDDLNGALFTWYESPSKRYNLWTSAVFNTMKAYENGSILNDSIFTAQVASINKMSEAVRLTNSRRIYRQNSFMLKQTFFVGRIDSLDQEITKKILPTNRVTYTFKYNTNSYAFQKDQALSDASLFPIGRADATFTNDSTHYSQVQNEFIYSFFLRAKSSALIKNELKLDAGIRHDFYNYSQMSLYRSRSNYYEYSSKFQNITLLGNAGYRFSNRIDLNVDLQQIFQGRNTGDFLYEAKSNVLLSKSVGRIVLGAYFQNKSPEQIYDQYVGSHYEWAGNDIGASFDRTKTINASFSYLNDKLGLDASAKYYLIDKYLYFRQQDSSSIHPAQLDNTVNLLQISLGKRLKFGKFTLDSYVVYQKTDNDNILRTPELYTFNSFYLDQTFFKVLKTNIGFDIRYNTPYYAYSYSIPADNFM